MNDALKLQVLRGIESDDRTILGALLRGVAERRAMLDDPGLMWGKPMLAAARSVETAKLLVSLGADVERVGAWWGQGFGAHTVDRDVARYLVGLGAALTPHAAAALGLLEELAAMIDADPGTVHAAGGDGGTPLHFARNVEIAALLADRGSRLDARDEDHDSTPAQWLVGDRPAVAALLIERGATPDIFLAAALGDRDLAARLIAADRNCLGCWIGKPPFPGIGHEGRGGTILQWSLGFNSFAHQIAARRGHEALCAYLCEESDLTTRFLVACLMADRPRAESIAAADPRLVDTLGEYELELVARYCWETNADLEAVRLMLDVGFPVDLPERSHGWKPLHNAAWGGYADLVRLLLERGHRVDEEDPEHHGTPLSWARWSGLEVKGHPDGDYERVVAVLIDAGSPWDPTWYPTGDSRFDRALEPRLRERIDGAALLGDAAAVEAMLGRAAGGEGRAEALALALVGAAKGGHLGLCERLLDAGAEIRAVGELGATALHKAVVCGDREIVELLLARGADVRLRNRVGSSVLHVAGRCGSDRAIIDLLVRHGAADDLSSRNDAGGTPLSLAVEGGHEATAGHLRSLGAERPAPEA